MGIEQMAFVCVAAEFCGCSCTRLIRLESERGWTAIRNWPWPTCCSSQYLIRKWLLSAWWQNFVAAGVRGLLDWKVTEVGQL